MQDEQSGNRELFGNEAASSRAEETSAPHVHAEPPKHHEFRPHADKPTEPAEVIAPKPVKPALVPPAPPAAFHAVSQHDEVADETHKPVRRRRQGAEGGGLQEAQPLQLVETQVEVQPITLESDEPRRPVRRRRRGGGSAESEPLMLVETQQPADGSQPGAGQ